MANHPQKTKLDLNAVFGRKYTVAMVNTNGPRIQAQLDASSPQEHGWFERASLPQEIYEGAARRLGTLGLLTACALVVFFAIFFPQSRLHVSKLFPLPPIVAASAFLLSLSIFWISRAKTLGPHLLLNIGVGYQILMALLIGIVSHTAPWEIATIARGWSGVAVWIIIFAVIVPGTPARTLWISGVMALMDFCGLLITVALGNPFPPATHLAPMFVPTLVAVLIAVVSARINFRMGKRLQEMQKIGSYQLIQRLGQGGMGEVWRAKHEMLSRPAAIKIIRPDALAMGDGTSNSDQAQEILHRFEREAQATALLESEHTIEIYDFGISTDGLFFYVMELLDGMDLELLITRHGPIPPERAVFLLRQVCDSLAEAHAERLVHRDIKPSNIYLCRRALKHDVVKVLDFGLVKSSSGWSGGDKKLTAAGNITGTPTYMAPEIIENGKEIDGRADLYSLGCVAYWLLCGELVFDATSPMKMVACHLTAAPPPLSERAKQTIPQPLEELIHACLAKDPALRPQSAQEFAEGLSATGLDGTWTQDLASTWWETNARSSPQAGPSADAEPVDPMAHTLVKG